MKIDNIISINFEFGDYIKEENCIGFSALNTISQCPMRGIVGNVLRKTFAIKERNLALECGDLCHKVFAVWRACSLCNEDIRERYIKYYLRKALPNMNDDIFNENFDNLYKEFKQSITPVSGLMIFCNYILDNCGYYDEENDKKRTLENIRQSLSVYANYFLDIVKEEPVFIDLENDIVGIEIPIKTRVHIKYLDNGQIVETFVDFIGILDGLHRKDNRLIIHENKTASRLDDSWINQWQMSHQITSYSLISSAMFNTLITECRVLGLQIPQPKLSGNGFRTDIMYRNNNNYENWARWIIHQSKLIDEYKDIPEKSPMFTSACSNFYSTCPFLNMCSLDCTERANVIQNEMVTRDFKSIYE